MKKILLTAIAAAGMLVATSSQASLSFSSIAGSSVVFTTGSQFNITDSSSPVTSMLDGGVAQWQTSSGLYGAFAGGPWTYGAITINNITGQQTANVGTGGTFKIDDGVGTFLTGNINWVQIYTLGSTGGLNAGATVNVSGIAYSGGNSDLLALLTASGDGSMNLTFQFTTTETLTQLSQNGGSAGSYSGSLTAVPEASTLLAGMLLLLPLGASTLRILRRRRMA